VNPHAAAAARGYRKLAACTARPRAHSGQAHSAFRGVVVLEPFSVIYQTKMNARVAAFQFNSYASSLRVPRNIGQSFLNYTKYMYFRVFREALIKIGFIFDLDSGSLREPFAEPTQAGIQTEIVKDGGMQ